MHTHRSFRNPPALPHAAVVETLERALRDRSFEGEVADTLVGTALNDDDHAFVEHWCVEVGTRAEPGSPLLGLAGLCLGHTARRFGRLGDEAVKLAESLASRAEADPADVDGRAMDGFDDVRSFLGLWPSQD
ncbi:hypothetical protein AVR91_0221920 [Amycolatopsis keratiniphila subsp. keratiniphila]|uniref:Uncharacterized protein n=1 Tax=Amycolatopsis keratiniphila subsp. keratiniphila TaxID=227715 RepID=A0A1W2LS00_9PSEU|nr:hypothetical protein AVR91_0221920 [Amycolatopsis keratiniphila subsp. keratiniphila]